LAINEPGDSYEQEADRVAEQVMRMPAPAALPLQRKCACGGSAGPDGECEACKAKHLGIQRRTANHAEPSTAPAIVHEVLGRSGQPLDPAARAYFEPRFRADFSGVRVHMDAQAAESARAVNALAYTAGRDVVFGTGQFQPRTQGGQGLLAHELTHVMQQDESVNHLIQKKDDEVKTDREVTSLLLLQLQDDKSTEIRFNVLFSDGTTSSFLFEWDLQKGEILDVSKEYQIELSGYEYEISSKNDSSKHSCC